MNHSQKIRDDLNRLISKSEELKFGVIADAHNDDELEKLNIKGPSIKKVRSFAGVISKDYQTWYTEASAAIRQLIPERYPEFISYYNTDLKRKSINQATFTIQDWVNGYRASKDFRGEKSFDDFSSISSKINSQAAILKACEARFTSTLLDIRSIVQADLLESELDASRQLAKHGYLRAAGAICGVVLERHLESVAFSHSVKVKKNPTLADLNDPLKTAGIYDVPVWRNIQRLADIRNYCCHNKGREPTKDEVEELIDGSSKITKTVF